MKTILQKAAVGMLTGALLFSAVLPPMNLSAAEPPVSTTNEESEVKQFMDCFEPMPIINELSEDCWGADVIGARDQGNGLEDSDLSDYCYWDGAIIKNPDPNGEYKYYMFASRWNQAGGHWGQDGISGWQGSQAIYSVSNNLYGPYEDKGPLWPEWCEGAGHNVFPFAISESDSLYAKGYRYAISISDTGMHGDTANGTLHISKSLDGPWELIDNGKNGKLNVDTSRFSLSNISIAIGPDGKYIATNRNGDIARADSIDGEWSVQSTKLWWNTPGMSSSCIEDPVIWYSDGLYHIVVNKWDTRMAYYLTSEDGVTWRRHSGIAYTPGAGFLRYENGVVNDWTKLERPNIYVEDGSIKAMTFAVIDVQKEEDFGNDKHGSKITVVPFSADKLQQLDAASDPIENRAGILPAADSTIQSWNTEVDKNYGSEKHIQLQRSIHASTGLFGEGERPENGYDCKIGFVKYDIADLLGENQTVDSAYLSVVYEDLAAGSAEREQIQVSLSEDNWEEGNGKENGEGANGNQADAGTLTWRNQPAVNYNPADPSNTIAYSEIFHTSDMNRVVDIDITKLVRNFVRDNPDATTISFALNEAATGNRVIIGSKEAGEQYAPRLILNTKENGVPVTGITLDENELTVDVETSQKLTASITPDNADNKNISWTSSNATVAEVDESGIVTGKSSGMAVITATSQDGGYTAKCTVTVTDPAVTDPAETMLLPSADTYVQSPDDSWTENYSTSDILSMKKDSNFDKLWAGRAGHFGEWATENGSRPDEWYNNGIAYLNYDMSSLDLTQELENASLTLTYQGNNDSASETHLEAALAESGWDAETVTWQSMPALLYDTEDIENTIAVSEGFTGKETGRTVTIDVTKLVNSFLQTREDNTSMNFGLNVSTVNKEFKFGSAESGEATSPTLKLRFKDSSIPVTGVTLSESELTMNIGDTKELTATISPEDATNKDLVWRSEDSTVAEADNGKITAKKAGTTKITATTVDGSYTAECTVTVNESDQTPVPVSSITLDKDTLTLPIGGTDTLTAFITPSDATDKNVIWSSKDSSVATVDKNGAVNAVAAGSTVITAKTLDGGFTAECTVIVTGSSSDKEEPSTSKPDHKSDVVNTGDTSTFLGTIIVLVITACTGSAVLFMRKKKNQ
ncbi:MAG: Ig-like domain-containing protein [Hespellia sp.]|nr:Ig-like domain-containing protein [Hespellia sp.]